MLGTNYWLSWMPVGIVEFGVVIVPSPHALYLLITTTKPKPNTLTVSNCQEKSNLYKKTIFNFSLTQSSMCRRKLYSHRRDVTKHVVSSKTVLFSKRQKECTSSLTLLILKMNAVSALVNNLNDLFRDVTVDTFCHF